MTVNQIAYMNAETSRRSQEAEAAKREAEIRKLAQDADIAQQTVSLRLQELEDRRANTDLAAQRLQLDQEAQELRELQNELQWLKYYADTGSIEAIRAGTELLGLSDTIADEAAWVAGWDDLYKQIAHTGARNVNAVKDYLSSGEGMSKVISWLADHIPSVKVL